RHPTARTRRAGRRGARNHGAADREGTERPRSTGRERERAPGGPRGREQAGADRGPPTRRPKEPAKSRAAQRGERATRRAGGPPG
ncbi:hypothetical protein C3R30_21920, partial [Mycobacterium tuberculosis]